MRHFCTYFDVNYLPQGLALYESLERHCPSFRLWILCMDDECRDILSGLALPHARLISLSDFEDGDAALLTAKQNRSRIEYYFTCTPSLPLYVLERAPDTAMVTYLDADLFFYGDPGPIFDEMGDGSVLVIEQRCPPELRYVEERTGRFNVGFLSFRREEQGVACLRWWREMCLDWCHDRCEDGRFADQKYLDRWPALFARVVSLKNRGAGLAPWNLESHDIRSDGDSVTVDGEPLIFYHFGGFKPLRLGFYRTGLKGYGVDARWVTRRRIYRPYIQAVLRGAERIREFRTDSPPLRSIRSTNRGQPGTRRIARYVRRAMGSPLYALTRVARLLRGEITLTAGQRVLW